LLPGEEKIKMKKLPYKVPQRTGFLPASSLPLKTHISYKEKERNLLVMEEELMSHYNMNRSDLHKHFIRSHYQMIKMPQVEWR